MCTLFLMALGVVILQEIDYLSFFVRSKLFSEAFFPLNLLFFKRL